MKISTTQSDLLDLSRWVAAWLVVAAHARSLMFISRESSQHSGVVADAFYFITGFGHEAVSIFFVISGYLVGGKAWTLMRCGRFAWRKYLVNRATRLYAVLLAALLLGGILDFTGSHWFNAAGLYDLSVFGRMPALQRPPVDSLTVKDFLLNALFLQTIAGPTFGSNGPLWSIANEWWYYIAFPALCLTFLPSTWASKICGALIVVGLAFVLPLKIIVLFGVWCLGFFASLFEARFINPSAALCIFFGVLFAARLEIVSGFYFSQYAVGAAFALLLASLAGSETRFPARGISENLAGFSYSVYLIHFPAVVFMVSTLYALTRSGLRMPVDGLSLAIFMAVFFAAILSSWLVSLLTEAKTPQLRSAAYRWFGVARQHNQTD